MSGEKISKLSTADHFSTELSNISELNRFEDITKSYTIAMDTLSNALQLATSF